MKRLIILIMMVLVSSVNAATLKWDNPVPMTNDGTKIYYQTSSEEEWSFKSPGTETELDVALLNLTPGVEYNIWAVGYKGLVESTPSNTVNYTLPVPEPNENKKPVVIYIANPVEQVIINVGQ